MTYKRKSILATALAISMCGPVNAQWSSEPATSAIEVTNAGNTPHIAPDGEGGIYVSYRNGAYYWRNPDNSGFDVLLQHYDANGVQSWPEPVKVFDTSKGFASYYSVVVDEDDNAYIANDIHPFNNPHDHATVQIAKVKKDGTLAWESPLDLSPDADYESNGLGITMDANGEHLVVTWAKSHTGYTVDGFSALAGFNKNGEILWQKDIRIGERYTFVTKPIVMDDSVMVLLEVADEVNSLQTHYYMQKYDLQEGTQLWDEPIPITSGGNFSHPVDSALSVEMVQDGEGGVVLSWYHITGLGEGFILVQHVRADGSKDFAGQGLRVSGDLLGNGSTSLVYDGSTTYVVWPVRKKDFDEEGTLQDYSGIRGVAISRQGEFIWQENGVTEPTFLQPWTQLRTDFSLPFDQWFKGYTNPRFTLNQNGKLNLTYGEETNFAYYLKAQVIDPTSGEALGEPVDFSDGPIEVDGQMATSRTIFGQPVMAYPLSGRPNGPIKLLNFDGSAHSGMSQEVLVEQVSTQYLRAGEQKNLSLKVLDNVSNLHESMVNSASEDVSAQLMTEDDQLNVTIAVDALLNNDVPVTVTVQDQNDEQRVGTSVINVSSPLDLAPVISPIADMEIEEGQSVTVTAEVETMYDMNPEIDWQQSAGPAIEFQAEGRSLTINSQLVAEDTMVSFTVSAANGAYVASQNVNITVKNTTTPTISGDNASAEPGMPFTLSPMISNAKMPVNMNWTQASGANTVFTMTEDGTLNGTAPLSAGPVTFLLHAVDANGESFSQEFQLDVTEPEQSSGGSLSWFGILFGLLAIPLRRKGQTKQQNV